MQLHPHAAQLYAARVQGIQKALASGDAAGLEAVAWSDSWSARFGEPTPRRQPVGMEIEGELAALITVNDAGTIGMAPQKVRQHGAVHTCHKAEEVGAAAVRQLLIQEQTSSTPVQPALAAEHLTRLRKHVDSGRVARPGGAG